MESTFYRKYGKRLLDLAIATLMLALMSPVLLVTAICVRIWLGSPVIFTQERPGLRGKRFRIRKFRSMTDRRDMNGQFLPDERRLPAFGKLLRSTSIDELPELWNVIRGEMSVVGPRPLKVEYLSLYTPEQARRHDVLPGITGWAQVNGRNTLGWEERFQHDNWYVDNCCLSLDLKILWMTIAAVLWRKGVAAEGHCTMPEFNGSTNSSSIPQIVVIGAGGHGKVVVSTLQAAGTNVEAVYDDNPSRWGTTILGVPVVGPIDRLNGGEAVWGVLGIGDNLTRERLARSLSVKWLTAIHPRAVVHPTAVIGEGTVIFAGAVIQPDAVIGRHCIVNTSSSVDHDCKLGDFVAIGPGARLSGTVVVGDRSLLGTGSSVIPSIQISNDVIVGAGTVVIHDLLANCTLVGATPRVLGLSKEVEELKTPA